MWSLWLQIVYQYEMKAKQHQLQHSTNELNVHHKYWNVFKYFTLCTLTVHFIRYASSAVCSHMVATQCIYYCCTADMVKTTCCFLSSLTQPFGMWWNGRFDCKCCSCMRIKSMLILKRSALLLKLLRKRAFYACHQSFVTLSTERKRQKY